MDRAEANKRLQDAGAAHKAGDLGRAAARHPQSFAATYEFWCCKPFVQDSSAKGFLDLVLRPSTGSSFDRLRMRFNSVKT